MLIRWLAAVLDGLSAGLAGVAVTPYMQALSAPPARPTPKPDPGRVRARLDVWCEDCREMRTSTAPRWRCDTCGSASLALTASIKFPRKEHERGR